MSIRLPKKYAYLIYSALSVISLIVVSYTQGHQRTVATIVSCIIIICGAYFSQSTLVKRENLVTIFLMPIHVAVGALLSLYYFPNLGLPTRLGALISVGFVLYAVSLMNNIFLVVSEKGSLIPLYRVALTWSQILVVVVAIPFFAGMYKIPINAFYQNLFVSLSAFLFSLYLLHIQSFDTFTRKIEAGDRLMFSLFAMFIVFSFGISVSFLPTKSFLRSLCISSVLMGVLGYLQGNLRNDITQKVVREYSMISLVFLLLTLLFRP